MTFHRIAAIIIRQYYLLRSSLPRILRLFIWVAVDIILWGFISKYLNTFETSGFNFIPTLLGAVILWDFLIRVMQGVSMAFCEDVWSRNFLNFFTTPLKISEYICGLVLSSVLTSSVGLTVMLVLAATVFSLNCLVLGLMCIPFLFMLFLFGIALGVAGCAMVLRLGPAAEFYIWSLPAFIAPCAGVFYPLSTLPQWMQYVAYMLPPAYVFEGMRSIIADNGSFSWFAFGAGGCLTAIYVFIACWFFTRTYGMAVRSGLIARYGAENLD